MLNFLAVNLILYDGRIKSYHRQQEFADEQAKKM